MNVTEVTLVLADAAGFAHPLISALTIFLLAAVLGAKLFSETTPGSAITRLSLLVGISGAAILGAIVAAAASSTKFGMVAGVLALAFATAASVGGFLIARRLSSGAGGESA